MVFYEVLKNEIDSVIIKLIPHPDFFRWKKDKDDVAEKQSTPGAAWKMRWFVWVSVPGGNFRNGSKITGLGDLGIF